MELHMSLEEDQKQLALQEERLQFDSFNADTALDIGLRLRTLIVSRGLKAAIDIHLAGHALFFSAIPGSTPINVDWVKRKRNVVMRFHKSSYAVKLDMKKNEYVMTERYGLDPTEFVSAGGAFPIRLRGSGVVGTIAISGLPEREDHGVIIEVLAEVLGHDISELALPKE
jgi:uncharacterized protein (UPF0303 family)